MSAQNTYNTNSTGTRFKSHIPGTQAHRERKFTDHQATASYNNPNQAFGAQGGPQYNASGAGFTNAPANPVASNAAGPGPGPAPGRAPVPATMGERADELHGRRHFFPSTSHGTTSAGTAKPHMGDKALGSTQATLGRATHNPALEQAGMERKVCYCSFLRRIDVL